MIQLEFRFEDRAALAEERFEHPHPHVQRKMEALWLKSLDLPHRLICQICCISGNTLREYLRDYQQGGIARLKEVRCYRPAGALAPLQKSVEETFQKQPPRSVKEAAARIAALSGVRRGLTQVRHWMHRWGLRYRKVGMIPPKPTPRRRPSFGRSNSNPACTKPKPGSGGCSLWMRPISCWVRCWVTSGRRCGS